MNNLKTVLRSVALTDQIVSNSTTLVSDTGLSLILLPFKKYSVIADYFFNSTAVADLKCAFTALTAAAVVFTTSLGSSWLDEAQTVTISTNGIEVVSYNILIETGNVEETLRIRFAQNTAEVSNTTRLAGSLIVATEVID